VVLIRDSEVDDFWMVNLIAELQKSSRRHLIDNSQLVEPRVSLSVPYDRAVRQVDNSS
jgi:hypothetical protein